jgi:hypothetical protein
MKLLLLFIFSLASKSILAQGMDTVSLSTNKTVYILFDSEVTMAETGTKDFAVIFKDNMALVKALKETNVTTTLMVRTRTDVRVWIIKYNLNPERVLIDTRNEVIGPGLEVTQSPSENKRPATDTKAVSVKKGPEKKSNPLDLPAPAFIESRIKAGNRDSDIYDPALLKNVWKIMGQPTAYFDIGEKENGIYFVLQNIYVDKHYIYLKMSMYNTSSIAFDIDFMSFERIQSSGLRKREIKNTNMIELAHRESVVSVLPNTEEAFVYVLPLFAPNDKDKVRVKVNEMGGARSFEFDIPVKEIVNAKTIL